MSEPTTAAELHVLNDAGYEEVQREAVAAALARVRERVEGLHLRRAAHTQLVADGWAMGVTDCISVVLAIIDAADTPVHSTANGQEYEEAGR